MSRCRLVFFGIMCCAIAACDNKEGKKYELHFPLHPPNEFTVDILVTSNAPRPKQTGNVVVIPVSTVGQAQVRSIDDLRGWKKWYVITPSGRFDGRHFTIDSNWVMASEEVSVPGGKGSKTVEEGSRYVMKFKWTEPPTGDKSSQPKPP